MTQNKNKKGIAKKALSISLVAAMLATSNVPVWASGFTAENFDAEAQVQAEGFEVEETTPAAENEAVDNAENSVDLQANDQGTEGDYKYDFTITENGWGSKATASGKVYVRNGENETATDFEYEWYVDDEPTGEKGVARKDDNYKINAYKPTYEQYGKTLSLRVWAVASSGEYLFDMEGLAKTTIGKFDVTGKTTVENELKIYNPQTDAEIINEAGTEVGAVAYTGKDMSADTKFHVNPKFGGRELSIEDFDISYSSSTGDYVNAGALITVTATPKDDHFTGTLTRTYRIDPIPASNENIKVSFKTPSPSYEYTGENIDYTEDLVITDALSGADLTSALLDVVYGAGEAAIDTVGAGVDKVTLNPSIATNFTRLGADGRKFSVPKYYITARNLANCTVTIDPVKDKDRKYNQNDLKGKVHIFADGKELTALELGEDYTVTIPPEASTKGTYTVTVEAAGDKTVNHTTAKLAIVDAVFDNAVFSGDKYLKESEPYTGEAVIKDIDKLGELLEKANSKNVIDKDNYDISFEGRDVGTGYVVVTGKGTSYEGAYKKYAFPIHAAVVTKDDISVAKTVVFDPSFKSASEYDIPVVVKANSYYADGKLAKSFDSLEEGTDYVVSHKFDGGVNDVRETITTTITIINDNFKGAKTSFTFKTTITKKQFSNVTITADPTSYVYTGKVIKPTLTVMDGDEPLYEDVDYTISVDGGIDVGTYTATIRGMGGYDDGTTATVQYTITPADISDVVVKTTADVVYTGKAVKPAPDTIEVTYNGVDVKDQVRISYPTANINAGEGTMRLTPGTNNKNFTGSVDVPFTIRPAELEGTLKVFDGNQVYKGGQNDYLLDGNGILTFKYENKEFTFDKVTFTPTGDMSKLVTEDDYEIRYIDNKYGKDAYVAVIGKNNFAGSKQITNAEGEIVKSVATYQMFKIDPYEIKEQHVTFGDAEYAGGVAVTPEVTVVVAGRTLEESKDYILDYNIVTEVNNEKILKVTVTGINGYVGEVTDNVAVVKKDIANCDIVVNGNSVTVMNGKVTVPSSEYTVSWADETVTVTAASGSKYYTGSQTVDRDIIAAPGNTVLSVTGRTTSTVSLAWEEVEGAEGYTIWFRSEYDTKMSRKIIQGGDVTSWTQTGLQPGTKYFYAMRAWVQDDEGKYVFSEEQSPTQRGTTKPIAARIASVSVSNGKIKVNLAGPAAGAEMYSMCYGDSRTCFAANDFKVGIRTQYTNRTLTPTFEPGTYYVCVKSYRDLGNGKRVYGAWSNTFRAVVK